MKEADSLLIITSCPRNVFRRKLTFSSCLIIMNRIAASTRGTEKGDKLLVGTRWQTLFLILRKTRRNWLCNSCSAVWETIKINTTTEERKCPRRRRGRSALKCEAAYCPQMLLSCFWDHKRKGSRRKEDATVFELKSNVLPTFWKQLKGHLAAGSLLSNTGTRRQLRSQNRQQIFNSEGHWRSYQK